MSVDRATSTPASFDRGTVFFIRNHTDKILMLPEPGEEWLWPYLAEREDTPDNFPTEQFVYDRGKLRSIGAIRAVGEDTYKTDPKTVWQTDPDVYEHAQAEAERQDELPCGHHSGFETIDPEAGVYECRFAYCNARYDRATIEEVFF